MKIIRSVILVLTLITTGMMCMTSSASPYVISGLNDEERYELYSEDFEGTGSGFEVIESDMCANSGNFAYVNESHTLLSSHGLGGKTYFSVRLMAKSADAGLNITFGGVEKLADISVNGDGGTFSVLCADNAAFTGIGTNEWFTLSGVADLDNSQLGLELQTSDGGKDYTAEIPAFSALLTDITLSAEQFYIDDIAVSRPIIVSDSVPLIYTSAGHIAAVAKTGGGKTLYVAAYSGESLEWVAASDSGNAEYAEIYTDNSTHTGTILRAFVWDSNLKPCELSEAEYEGGSLFSDSFESAVPGTNTAPAGWGFYSWATGSHDYVGAGVTSEFASDGQNSVYVDAVQSNYACYIKILNDKLSAPAYALSLDIKYSDDAENIAPYISIFFYKDNIFLGGINAVGSTSDKSDWQNTVWYFAKTDIEKYDYDRATLLIGARAVGTNESKGRIYFDNVRFGQKPIVTSSAIADIHADKFGAWYTLGDEVTYVSDSNLSRFAGISGTVYDSFGNAVFENTVSAQDMQENGWRYTPSKLGYYEVEFVGKCADGTSCKIEYLYTKNSGGQNVEYTLNRHSFAVVGGSAKPMNERSNLFMLSDNASDEERLRLADMVGFSGIRIHGVPWGDTAAEKGFHLSPGQFDFTYADKQIDNVTKYGFKNIISNVFATPKWAAPGGIENKWTNVGLWYANCYAPADMKYAAEGYSAYADRYKDRIDGIEIWNEPYYNEYSFWHGGTDSFAELTTAAYSAIKQTAPELTVYSAGFNLGERFFADLMKNGNYRNSFDAISFHGHYPSTGEDYRSILKNYGMENIPLIDSEGYYYAYYTKGNPKDYEVNNMVMYLSYLMRIKHGIRTATMFEIADYTDDEVRVSGNGSHQMGLFRSYPYYEPHSGAVAAYNLFNLIGEDVSYIGEYILESRQKAAAVQTDGQTLVFVWNTADEDFALSEKLAACMNDDSKILDFEDNEVQKNQLRSKRVYCITNINAQSLGNVEKSDGRVLSESYVAPYYTCVDGKGNSDDEYDLVHAVYTNGELFDSASTEEHKGNIYNRGGFEWMPEYDGAENSLENAEFALSFTDSGMYIIVNVTDSSKADGCTDIEKIGEFDGVHFSIDSRGKSANADRNEFYVGKLNGKAVLYKYNASELNETVPGNFSPSKTILGSKYVSIEDNGNDVSYKIFVPISELFPFVYGVGNRVRFAISVTDGGENGKLGELSYGGGLCTPEPQVWKYALTDIGGFDANAEFADGAITVFGNVFDESDSVNIKVLCDGKICNFTQAKTANGKYKYTFGASQSGRFEIYVSTNASALHCLSVNIPLDFKLSQTDVGVHVSGNIDCEFAQQITAVIRSEDNVINIDQFAAEGDFSVNYPLSNGEYTVSLTAPGGETVRKNIIIR